MQEAVFSQLLSMFCRLSVLIHATFIHLVFMSMLMLAHLCAWVCMGRYVPMPKHEHVYAYACYVRAHAWACMLGHARLGMHEAFSQHESLVFSLVFTC